MPRPDRSRRAALAALDLLAAEAYNGRMHTLGICAILKDEDAFIHEWMAYYTLLGAEAFYLYDNGSKTPLRKTLANHEPFHTPESLRIHDAPGVKLQMIAYGHCLAAYKHACRWIAFVDIDEFIVPLQHDTIPDMMEEYAPYAGLGLNWKIFGTSGHAVRPKGLVIENFTRVTPDAFMEKHVKSIVDPRMGAYFPNPHICAVTEGSPPVVSERHAPVTTALSSPPSWTMGQVNHYYYRSKQDYYAKLRRPRADTNELRPVTGRPHIPEGDAADDAILRFVPGVRNLMRKVGAGPS